MKSIPFLAGAIIIADAVTELLENHVPRTARVPTAIGRGLFLWKVFYRHG